MCTIRPNHEIKADLFLILRTILRHHLEPRPVLAEICADQFMVKEKGDVRHLLEHIQKPLVEAAAIDCKDGLFMFSI